MASALLTDLYQLTMACGYWREGLAERRAVFHLFFRRNPFGGGFAIASGLAPALEHLLALGFGAEELAYLASLRGRSGKALFPPAFLAELGRMRPRCDVHAMPEGTAVFPGEPLLRLSGPLAQCQILETPLLNLLNFHTLIATKAARICRAAAPDPVVDFGLRRAQGVNGGLAASRAAYIGGCAGTSNLLAGQRYGIPVRGTHAHSWVMAFEEEEEAFAAYARAMPEDSTFLVDTFDTLEGVERALRVAAALRERGHEMVGVRLDSGELAPLSRQVRRRLDAAGFPEAKIVASSDLDEHRIARLKAEGAAVDVWGVGTRLVTAWDQPALGGVFKLAALASTEGALEPKLKLSEQEVKTSNPGPQQVRRYRRGGRLVGDVIYDSSAGLTTAGAVRELESRAVGEDLLRQVVAAGRTLAPPEPLERCRRRVEEELSALPEEVLALRDPVVYPVVLDEALARRKEAMIASLRAS